MVVVVAFGSEEEPPQFAAVQAATFGWMDLGSAHVLSRVRCDPPIDVSEAVGTADRRKSPIDGRCGQTSLLQPTAVQLDVRSGRLEDGDADPGGLLEIAAQVVAVGVERSAGIAGQERGCRQLRLVKEIVGLRKPDAR
jgi:hypothetical protein